MHNYCTRRNEMSKRNAVELASIFVYPLLRASIRRESSPQLFYYIAGSVKGEQFALPKHCTIGRCIEHLCSMTELTLSPHGAVSWKERVAITTEHMEGMATYSRIRDKYTLNIRRLSDRKTVLHAIEDHVYSLENCILEVLACEAWGSK